MTQPIRYSSRRTRAGQSWTTQPKARNHYRCFWLWSYCNGYGLALWADKSVTPKSECAWALSRGYKAPKQGTYYGYFAPAAKRYGLKAYAQRHHYLWQAG